MTTNFTQTGTDIDQYLIPITDKNKIPLSKRKPGIFWGFPSTLWAWGSNNLGNLGLGDRTHRSSPVQVGSLNTWSNISNSA